jgi:DNA-binding NarL/FixJ family response regulator
VGVFHTALARLTPPKSAALILCARLFADPARATPVAVDELETMISRLHDETDPAAIVRIGKASFFVDRMTGCREAHWRVVRDGREGGAVASAIHAIINLCLDDYLVGEWDEAQQLADEGLALCEAHGYQLLESPLWFAKAIVAAARGEGETARALADEMDRWAAPRRAGVVQSYARQVRGLAALGRGDFEAAYHDLSSISPPGTLPSHVPLALWVALDLVDAAVRTNRHAEAVAHADVMRRAALAALSPRLALVSLGCAAIASAGGNDIELFEQALAIPGAGRWPFDVARVQLAYGERLRRARAIAPARKQLGAALETFQRLGARTWAARASNELRATGAPRLGGNDFEPGPLTAQEREIAQLAATGLTNKQIGEKLFLSHRTVGTHLYRVFPKLGITSRAALRDALAALL